MHIELKQSTTWKPRCHIEILKSSYPLPLFHFLISHIITRVPSYPITTNQINLTATFNKCKDPRQYVPPSGHTFSSLAREQPKQKNEFTQDKHDPRIWFISTSADDHDPLRPDFTKSKKPLGIGQRAILIQVNKTSISCGKDGQVRVGWDELFLLTRYNPDTKRQHTLGPDILHRRRDHILHPVPRWNQSNRDFAPALLHHALGMGAAILLPRLHQQARRNMAEP
jgi:hypothetical protein